MRRFILAAAAALTLAACSQPYDPPAVFDENFSTATGTSTEAPSQGFAGLDDLAQMGTPTGGTTLPTRVLWTHGMCTPSDGTQPGSPYTWWQVRTRDLLAAYPGASQTGAPTITTLSPGGSQLIKETLNVPARVAGASRTMELWFFDWSPLTRPYKPRVIGDIEAGKGNPYTYERATVNRDLKQGLIKDCFADVVVYLGRNGDRIRSDAQIAVCDLLDGTFDRATGCAGASGARFTALVSESLGSTVLFDAFRSLRLDYVTARKNAVDRLMANAPRLNAITRTLKGPLVKPAPVKPTLAKPSPAMTTYNANVASANAAMGLARTNAANISVAMGSLTNFYLLANQLPLLNFAGTANVPLDEFVASAMETRKPGEGAAALTVVAFVDPNDVLSFRLVPKTDRGRVINFVVSNADTYLGYAELPTSAHCDYIKNGYVMHALVFGYAGGTPKSGAVDDPEPCL
jgi:hypothetical protein